MAPKEESRVVAIVADRGGLHPGPRARIIGAPLQDGAIRPDLYEPLDRKREQNRPANKIKGLCAIVI
jgi:hypothetical protein